MFVTHALMILKRFAQVQRKWRFKGENPSVQQESVSVKGRHTPGGGVERRGHAKRS
jgi:hypothetical protein